MDRRSFLQAMIAALTALFGVRRTEALTVVPIARAVESRHWDVGRTWKIGPWTFNTVRRMPSGKVVLRFNREIRWNVPEWMERMGMYKGPLSSPTYEIELWSATRELGERSAKCMRESQVDLANTVAEALLAAAPAERKVRPVPIGFVLDIDGKEMTFPRDYPVTADTIKYVCCNSGLEFDRLVWAAWHNQTQWERMP